MRYIPAFIAIGILFSLPASAQPKVNPDNTVTFRYKNDRAKSVAVDVQFAGAHEMVKGTDGVWTVTLGPAAPDIYPYCFKVDGVSVMDPENPEFFPNEGFKNSLLDIRGNGEPLVHALTNVPHGAVDYVDYYSGTMGLYGRALVYTPPFYDKHPDRKYPVMFLISGTTDTEEVYFKVGRMNLILDNLIASGAAKEMILVLPYGNPVKYFPAGTDPWAMGDMFGKDLVNDLLPYVDSHYRTIADRDHRGIGGFSRGGNQGLSIGLTNLDKFSYLCSYSSFTSMDLPGVYDDPGKLNELIHLFWLGVGTDDFLYGNAKEYMDFLDAKGIRNMKLFTNDKFGHTWMNAKYFLDQTFRLLFKGNMYPEEVVELSGPGVVAPKKAALKIAPVAPKPAGEGQKLTPEVMAKLFPKGVVSPEYANGGEVTFRLRANDASKVELEIVGEGKSVMAKDSEGVWSITRKLTPGIWQYAFAVDGTMIADPENMFISPGKGFKYSLAEVPSSVSPDIPHGKVSYRYFYSYALGCYRPMCVYTPAGYDPAGEEYLPVLYLPHGPSDTFESWFKVGHVNGVLDRMIAAGDAERMIVVMPCTDSPDETTGKVVEFIRDNYSISGKAFLAPVQKSWKDAGVWLETEARTLFR